MEERRASAWQLLLPDRATHVLHPQRSGAPQPSQEGVITQCLSFRTFTSLLTKWHFSSSHHSSQGYITNTGESIIWFQVHWGSNRGLTEAAYQAPCWADLQPGVQNRRRIKASAGPAHDGRTGPALLWSLRGRMELSAPLSKPPYPLLWKGLLATAGAPAILNTEDEAASCTDATEVSLHNPLMKWDCWIRRSWAPLTQILK